MGSLYYCGACVRTHCPGSVVMGEEEPQSPTMGAQMRNRTDNIGELLFLVSVSFKIMFTKIMGPTRVHTLRTDPGLLVDSRCERKKNKKLPRSRPCRLSHDPGPTCPIPGSDCQVNRPRLFFWDLAITMVGV